MKESCGDEEPSQVIKSCSICRSSITKLLICGECASKQVAPLRLKLERASNMMLELQARCRTAYEAKKEPHEAWELWKECEALSEKLDVVTKRVHRERLAIAKRRVQVLERRRKLEKAEQALSLQSAQLATLGRAILGDTQDKSALFFVPCNESNNVKMDSLWQKVSELFELFPIKRLSAPERGSLRGIMTIVGLPLPNVGTSQVLTTSVPRAVCCSALAAVAQLVYSVASVLGLGLPHPLAPRLGLDNAAAVYGAHSASISDISAISSTTSTPRSRAGALLGGIMAVTTGRDERNRRLSSSPGSSTRNGPTRYVLAPPSPGESDEQFAIALNLVQNNITHLCVKAGVDPANLWPAEAVLLNLCELHKTAIRYRDTAAGKQPATPLSPEPTARSPHFNANPVRSPIRSDNEDSDNEDWIFLGNMPFLGLASEGNTSPLPPLRSLPQLQGGDGNQSGSGRTHTHVI